MKTLIVFYSKTGFTKKVALFLAKSLKADVDEIKDIKSRKGLIRYLISGKEAIKKIIPRIKSPKKNPAKYGVVVFGTPLWGNVYSPMSAYLSQKKNFKSIAFFCTQKGGRADNALKEMQNLAGKPTAVLVL